MKRILFFCIIAGWALTSSCSVGPNYVRPSAEIPAAYKEPAGWKTAQPRDHLPRGKWWEMFRDPGLNALEEQVVISNQTIAQAEAQFRQAIALARSARSGYYPSITADASVSRAERTVSGSSGGAGTGGAVSSGTGTAEGGTGGSGTGAGASSGAGTDYSLSLGAVWEIDLWGRVRRSVESREASAQAAGSDVESARLSMQAAVAQNYFQLRVLDAQKTLLNETISAYEKSLQLTRNRYAAGVASRADVLQARTQLTTTQAQAIDLDVQRSQLEHAIAVLLGKPASVFSIPPEPLAAAMPGIPFGIPSELLERRPDIAGAERRVAAANAQIGVAMAGYYPALTLNAVFGYASSHLAALFTTPGRFWSVGPSLSETLFDGGLRRSVAEQARASYDASVAAYRQTVLTAFQEVEDNAAALRILEQEGRIQDEAVQAAQQSVTVATNQYKAGVVSYLNVIVTQAAALSNRRTALDIFGRRLTASVLLIKALGGGWNQSTGPALSGAPPAVK